MFFDNQDANAADPFLHAVGDEVPKLIARRDGRTAKGAEVYLARPDIGRLRPKHIHMSISGGASRLITQMYFHSEPNNVSDPMAILMGDAFERNIGKPRNAGSADVDEAYDFDIVVGGRNATFFE